MVGWANIIIFKCFFNKLINIGRPRPQELLRNWNKNFKLQITQTTQNYKRKLGRRNHEIHWYSSRAFELYANIFTDRICIIYTRDSQLTNKTFAQTWLKISSNFLDKHCSIHIHWRRMNNQISSIVSGKAWKMIWKVWEISVMIALW